MPFTSSEPLSCGVIPADNPDVKVTPCVGCQRDLRVRTAIRFPICPTCDAKYGPLFTVDERRAVVEQGIPLTIVVSNRGRIEVTADRLHVPAMFEKAKPDQAITEWSISSSKLLILSGPTGRGKTYQAVGAMRAILGKREGEGYLINCAGISILDRADYNRWGRCGVLALDDLGAKLTPGALTSAYELIDYRITNLLPLIVTTNLVNDDIAEMDARIGSRLGSGQWIFLDGKDRRTANDVDVTPILGADTKSRAAGEG